MITAMTLGGSNLITTQILLQSIQNSSFPAVVYTRSKRGGYQGSKLITPTFANYQLVMDFKIVGTSFSDLNTQRTNFMQIIGVVHSTGTQTLIITRSDGKQLQLDIKAAQVTGDYTTDDTLSSVVEVTLESEYPFFMNSAVDSASISIVNGGGFAIPFGIPLNMSNGQSNVVSVNNGGNYPAYPTYTFYGPLTNPTITDQTTGETLSIAYTIPAGQYITVDVYNRTAVLYPSGNSVRASVSGKWWLVPIGSVNVTLGNANLTDTGYCAMTFRDTYLNAI